MWAPDASSMLQEMSTLPPDMDLGATEEVCTSQQTEATTSATNMAKRKRLAESIPPTDIDLSSIYGDNYFGILGDLTIESTPTDSNNQTPGKAISDQLPTNKTVKPSAKKSFCPPIFLFNVNVKNLIDQLTSRNPPVSFKIKNVTKDKSKLFFSDPKIHMEMMRILREKKITAYSYTPMEFKQESFILRGLYHGSVEEEITEEFNKIVPGVVSKVTKYSTKYSIKNKLDTGLFLVTLNSGFKLTDVSNIKAVLSQMVTWEKPKRKGQELQCHRCQKWGHVAKNCTAEFKCVKCDNKHGPGECLRVVPNESPPHCVNCGESGHPANWRGCPSYKLFAKARKDRILKAQIQKDVPVNNINTRIMSRLRSPELTFAQLFGSQQAASLPQENKSNIVTEFIKLAKYFMQPEELSLEDEIKLFMTNYKNMPKQDATIEFTRLFNKLRSNGP